MYTEIEAKLKVDSLKPIEDILKQIGGEFVAEQYQSDIHFDDDKATMKTNDKCLRLRCQKVGGKQQFILTYKGPKEKSNFKKRREIEVEIIEADSLTQLLSALGYHEAMTIEKKRCLWRLDDCEVALDNLPLLGDFVEIEGPDVEKITHVQKRLGLADLPHIPRSYASLIRDEQHSKKH